jgi:SET domain
VFASRQIPQGTTVDISPVLILPSHESEGTTLGHYTYTWPAEDDKIAASTQTDIPAPSVLSAATRSTPFVVKKSRQALALGLGSMFNHRREPNVAWERNIATQSIRYFALRDIDEEEELCISYGPKLWFDDADGPEGEVEVEDGTEILSCHVDVFE